MFQVKPHNRCVVILRDQLKVGSIDCEIKPKREMNFYCSENPLIAHNLGTTGPIQVRFSAKCTSPGEHLSYRKLKMSHVQVPTALIPLDRITNVIILIRTLSYSLHLNL